MYSTDKPIEIAEDDLLGRVSFAKQLGKAILSDFSNDNVVIGLYGEWGSGKTSIINITENEIEKASSCINEESRPIVMNFSPWNFTTSENLIYQFFIELKAILTQKDSSKSLAGIGVLLEKYSDAFDLLEYLPGGRFYAPMIKKGSIIAGEALQNKASAKSIETIKKQLEQALRNQSHRIIVFIDDIDRLTDEQIRTVFQLVKHVAGLPNITYVLAMDRDIVTGALEKVQRCNGNEYLEKIVQIPFDIPQIDNERLQNILFVKLDKILEEYPDDTLDPNHWQRVYRYCVKPFIRSVRDINRLTNVFQFKYRLLHGEVNFADLLGITALSLYLPRMTAWISHNKHLLCEGVNDYHLISHDHHVNERMFSGLFKQLDIDEERAYEYLTSLFPLVSKSTGKRVYAMGDTTDNQLRKHLRIASPERFDLYFQLDLSQVSVSHEEVKHAAFEMEESELKEFIKMINEQGSTIFFLEEFQEIIPHIPSNRTIILLDALIASKIILKGEKQGILQSVSATKLADYCIEHLLSTIEDTKQVYEYIKDIIINKECESLSGIIELIRLQEIVHGRIGTGDKSVDKWLFTDEQLTEIEMLFVERFEEIVKKKQLAIFPNQDHIAFLWRRFAPESFEKYFVTEMGNFDSALRFISSINGKWRSNSVEHPWGWSIFQSSLKSFLNPSLQIIDQIQATDKQVLLSTYDDIELEKIATFVLNEDKTGDFEKASIIEARALVDIWKHE